MQTALAPVDALSDDDAGIAPAQGASSSMVACPQPIVRETVVVTPQSVHRIVMSNTCCKKHCFKNFRDSDGMSYVFKTAKHYHSLSKMEQDKFVRTQDYCSCGVVILVGCPDQDSTSFSCSHVFPCSNRHAHTSSDLRSSTWSRLPMHRKVMLQRWTQTKRFIWSFWAGLYVAKLSGKSFIWGTIGFIGFANLFGKVRLHAQWILEVFLLGWQESKAQRGQPCLTSFRAFGTQLLKSFPIPLTIAKGHDTDMSHSLATMQIQKQNSFHPGLSWTTSRCFSTSTLSVLYLTSFSLVVGPVILGIDSGFEKIQNMSNVQLAHVTSWY